MKDEHSKETVKKRLVINGIVDKTRYIVISNEDPNSWIKKGDPLFFEYEFNRPDYQEVVIFTNMRVDQGGKNDVAWYTLEEGKIVLGRIKVKLDKKWARKRIKECKDRIKRLEREYGI